MGASNEEDTRTEHRRIPAVDYGDRWECPRCGRLSRLCYRCDDLSCGAEIRDGRAESTPMWAGEEVESVASGDERGEVADG